MFRSLLFQIWAVFLVFLLALLCPIFVATISQFQKGLNIVFQRLYYEVASEIEKELRPKLNKINISELDREFTRLEYRDPNISLFLLDSKGSVIFTRPRPLANFPVIPRSFGLEPINRFLWKTDELFEPIYVRTEPALPTARIFTVSPAVVENNAAYLLALIDFNPPLNGSIPAILSRQELLLLVCLIFSSGAGFLLFYRITRRITTMGDTLEQFAMGDYTHRVVASGTDELGTYAQTFNWMADETVSAIKSLEQIEGHRRQLFANISHDLRRPMSSIINSFAALSDNLLSLGKEQQEEFLSRAKDRAQDLNELISAISELSMLDNPETTIVKTPLHLVQEVEYIITSFKPLAAKRDITLALEGKELELIIAGSKSLLHRAISNLVENALIYTHQGGRVEVRVFSVGSDARLDVSDTGIGVPAEGLTHLFVPFARGAEVRSQNKQGTGLGLAITKQIIELHQGTLVVKSTLGVGTTFSAKIPLL